MLTALGTTVVLELTVKPWLEARSERVRESLRVRYRLAQQATTILAACDRLEAGQQTSERATTTTREERDGRAVTSTHFGSIVSKIYIEKRRWQDQLDEATKVIVDSYESSGHSLVKLFFGELLADYALTARWVAVSDLPQQAKIQYLRSMTRPARTLFFSNWPVWLRNGAGPNSVEAVRAELRAAINAVKYGNVLSYEQPSLFDSFPSGD
ncbi:hypothetical protein [Streptomyces sp. NRRL F-5123]|uniref:hypothetical protein n=1 Tax=Streptomyces sp. NRRL F-5123 TaxID=1463856 RepID=UPI00131B93C5|nr:hypothetical protein [Streptomyces sp. NRRL F-5123]